MFGVWCPLVVSTRNLGWLYHGKYTVYTVTGGCRLVILTFHCRTIRKWINVQVYRSRKATPRAWFGCLKNKAFNSLAMRHLQLPVLMMLISRVITLLSLWEWKEENKSSDMESFFFFLWELITAKLYWSTLEFHRLIQLEPTFFLICCVLILSVSPCGLFSSFFWLTVIQTTGLLIWFKFVQEIKQYSFYTGERLLNCDVGNCEAFNLRIWRESDTNL